MRRSKDLTGKKFGHWMVRYRVENRGRYYECVCICGTVRIIRGYSLENCNPNFSCGCKKKSIIIRDLTDKRFGRWTVLKRDGKDGNNSTYYKCRCDCGTVKRIRGTSLTDKRAPSTSCGCYIREKMSDISTTHGMTGTKEYKTWRSIIDRCCNPNVYKYKIYGGVGIRVCKRWRESFEDFYEDMGPAPSPKHSIDRLRSDRGYFLSNCRWATYTEQNNNKRTNRRITFKGKTQTLSQWAREIGLKYSTLRERLNRGWDVERALTS